MRGLLSKAKLRERNDIHSFSPSVFAYGESTSLVRGRLFTFLFTTKE